jgi:hypothetical protein
MRSQLGTFTQRTVTRTKDFDAAIGDDVILVDAKSAPVTVTLPFPSATAQAGWRFRMMKVDASEHAVKLVTPSGEVIGRQELAKQFDSVEVWADGPSYYSF